ncbi:phosphate ABC transporter substrate-binding protein PstS [PVC group bacterium (ex Bugula neritina AB1)]|nr:phosphate ABC transporter substrate-binding protein PstS [PVC group bacterium (ex Bugula neritina AB1)]
MKRSKITIFLSLLAFLYVCPQKGFSDDILGAGASFPYPLYSKMFHEYRKKKGKKVNYQAIGSGGGQRQIVNQTVDFGATDNFIAEKNLKQIKRPLLHVPTCLGAVAVVYNIPGQSQLNLTQENLADIFLGKIKKWNDPRLSASNPKLALPNLDIVVVHRADSSGTSFVFTDFLSKVNANWLKKVGRGKSVRWPVGLGGKKNAGVASYVTQVLGSIGYLELAYALGAKLPQARIENKSGNFIKPTVLCTALAGDLDIPDDTRVSLTNSPALNAYPMASFTWLLLYKEQKYANRTKEAAKSLVDLIWWMLNEGQEIAEPLHYVPLPEKALEKAKNILRSVTYDDKPLLTV